MSSARARVVLHVDADAFFCQVSRLTIDPSLNAGPIAVQQEGGIIAADHAARALGVTKHSDARQADALLRPAGGRVISVFAEPGTDGVRVVSYRPYREMSAAMVRVLKKAAGSGAVVERASIDEVFLEAPPPPPPPTDEGQAIERGRKLADTLRAAALSELGLVLSVGVARNKLLAKLASRAAKPDGVFVVANPEAERSLLEATPVEKLPGMGGGVARALRRFDKQGGPPPPSPSSSLPPPSSPLSPPRLTTAADVQRCFGNDPAALAAATGLDLPSATRLALFAQGDDGGSPVVDRGPPRSLGAQHTLTPITVLSKMLPLAMRRETCPRGDVRALLPPLPARGSDEFRRAEAEEQRRRKMSGPGGGGNKGQNNNDDPPWLGPRVGGYTLLRWGAPGAASRLRRVLEALCRDLLGRVLLDRRDEGGGGRWPRKLRVSVGAMDPGLTAGPGGGGNNQSKKQQQQKGGGGAPVWGPCMGHASRSGDFPPQRLAAAAGATTGGGNGNGRSPERSLSVPPALLDATTSAAVALLDGLMSARAHYGCPIIALSVTATNFEGGGGGAGGGGVGGGVGARQQQQQQQQEIGRYFRRDEGFAGAKRAREEASTGGSSEETEEEEEEEGGLPPLQASSTPSPSPPPAAAPAAKRADAAAAAPAAHHPHQPVTLLRLPLVNPIVLHDPRAEAAPAAPAAASAPSESRGGDDHGTTVVARAAAPPAARKALFAAAPPAPPPRPHAPPPAPPGIRLTAVLSAIAAAAGGGDEDDEDGDGDGGEAAARALEAALRQAGARRILGRGGG